MGLFEELKDLGVDIDEGLERVMDDDSLYEMMLGMFIDSLNGNPISLEDFGADNIDVLIERVHSLKGLTGNLAMTPIFTKYTETLNLLRAGRKEEARAEFERLLPCQAAIVECIKRHIDC